MAVKWVVVCRGKRAFAKDYWAVNTLLVPSGPEIAHETSLYLHVF